MCDLIVYAPHPDDAELFCGGTLLRLASVGYRVGVVDLTEGESGTRGTPETRAKERAKASEVLGLAVRDGLKLPDMGLVGTDKHQLEAVVASLRERRPKVLRGLTGKTGIPTTSRPRSLSQARSFWRAQLTSVKGLLSSPRPLLTIRAGWNWRRASL